jgi:hypothetical protein
MTHLAPVLAKRDNCKGVLQQILARRERMLGGEHPDTLTATSNPSLVLGRQGKHEEAEKMRPQTLTENLLETTLGK